MAVLRENILTSPLARDKYIEGVKRLKREPTGLTSAEVAVNPGGLPPLGPPIPLNTYDLFILWHIAAMDRATPMDHPSRNAAHSGPVFLPWHRLMLLTLETAIQRVLEDDEFGLPYWDWAADSSPLFLEDCMGGAGEPVSTGPFRFDAADPNSWRVHIESSLFPFANVIQQLTFALPAGRGLNRDLGQVAPPATPPTLPTKLGVKEILDQPDYDTDPWDREPVSFRNRLEGWRPANSNHNGVHIWVGGDMGPGSSPNDPLFYLNHCNVDRIWERWMHDRGLVYQPDMLASDELLGHRIEDPLFVILSFATATPCELLNISNLYSYDTLDVEL